MTADISKPHTPELDKPTAVHDEYSTIEQFLGIDLVKRLLGGCLLN